MAAGGVASMHTAHGSTHFPLQLSIASNLLYVLSSALAAAAGVHTEGELCFAVLKCCAEFLIVHIIHTTTVCIRVGSR